MKAALSINILNTIGINKQIDAKYFFYTTFKNNILNVNNDNDSNIFAAINKDIQMLTYQEHRDVRDDGYCIPWELAVTCYT